MEKNELIEVNADLQESLTEENSKYYEKLIVYIRIMAFFRDEKKSEELLLEILRDILDGQEQGLSAEEYFGKNPKKIANEIIKQLPINLFDTIKIFLTALGVYSMFSILPELIFPSEGLDIGSLAIRGLYWSVIIIMALWFLGTSLYQSNNKKQNIVFILLVVVGVSVGFIINFSVSTVLKISLDGSLGILVITALVVALFYMYYKEKNKKLWTPFIPIVITSAILGILTRVAFFSELLSSKEGKLGVAIVLGISFFLQYVFIYLNSKQLNK